MLKLIKCGYNYVHAEGLLIDRPAGSGAYVFVLFRSGAELTVHGCSRPAERNMWIILRPSTAYAYKDTEQPYINDWFHFDGEEAEVLLEQLALPLDEPVRAVHPAVISRGIMELQSNHWLGGPHHGQIIDLDLRSFLLKLSNSLQLPLLSHNTARYYRQFSEIRSLLYSAPQTRYTVEALAAKVNLSKSYFQHIYRELFGCPVSLDMINGRLEFAKYMLEHSPLSVGAVSAACGYEHETHFMRQFKKFTGQTPSEYKSRLRSV